VDGKGAGSHVEDWLERYADALEERLGRTEEGVHLPRDARNPLLGLARVVAHGTERKNAPLATYIAGRYAVLRTAQGVDESRAVAEAVEIAESIAPGEQET
jgi:uncharacterized protein DUF6457